MHSRLVCHTVHIEVQQHCRQGALTDDLLPSSSVSHINKPSNWCSTHRIHVNVICASEVHKVIQSNPPVIIVNKKISHKQQRPLCMSSLNKRGSKPIKLDRQPAQLADTFYNQLCQNALVSRWHILFLVVAIRPLTVLMEGQPDWVVWVAG